MRTAVLNTFCLAAIFVMTACGHPTEWTNEAGFRWRPIVVPRGARDVGFTHLTASRTGVDFINRSGESNPLWENHLGHGSGVALGDVDGDGLVDIYLASLERSNALYRNLGDWRFENVTDASGVAAPGRPSTGAAFADVDGDGDADLLLTALGGPNSLFLNDGTGIFAEQTEEAGLVSDRASGTMTLADVDADGDLDLFVANYVIGSAEEVFSADELTFDNIVERVGGRYQIADRFRQYYRVRTIPEFDMVAYIQRAEPDWFYLNDGNGRFEAIQTTSGRFLDEDGKPLAEEPDYFSLAARFYDVDGDGDPDLFVCNDFSDPDLFWINDGAGNFRAAPRETLRATSHATMAVDFADIDRDGAVDFFTTDMLAKDSRERKAQMASYTALPKVVGAIEDRPQTQRNTLFLNRGDATFAQIAEYAGVHASDWTWATMFLDVDLDGYEDILVTTGHLWDQFNEDNVDRMRRMSADVPWSEKRRLFGSLATPNLAFRNMGDRTFEDSGDAWGFSAEGDVSHGFAAGDLDGDGDLDLVINRLGATAAVLANESTAPRVAVTLSGLPPNTQGVGAKIRVLDGAIPVQEREVTLGGMFLSSSHPQYAFATGDASEFTIVVDWRGGRQSVLHGARPNRLYEISEAGAPVPVEPEESPRPDVPIFTDVSDELSHVHIDEIYDDYQRQPLLPNKLSQLGPGVAWFDLDGDGDEDLILPSGRGGSSTRYMNRAGQFVRLPGASAPYDQTTALGLVRGSERTILLGQSIYEARDPREVDLEPAVFSIAPRSSAKRAEVPGSVNSVGPLALADIDGDGDLDLFVGGRVIPAAYPVAASSRLFLNDGGSFTPDETNSSAFEGIGMVSAAVFSDIDADSDPDLLLAIEWGAPRLLLNDAGRFTDATAEWGFDEHKSRWNGIATGDLNSDGLPDVVATSWGLNTVHRASPSRPLLVYYDDFDRNGSLDLLLAQYDDGAGGIVPLRESRSDVVTAIPSVGRRVGSSDQYASATVEEVLGPQAESARNLAATSLAHLLFLNTGSGFEAIPLPAEAQFAPAFYAGVADFDGDGHEDIVLAQNFFPNELSTPRYDAGRGLLLLGDGAGGLDVVPGQVSGIRTYGDQRGAAFADYNADGRIDLAVSQNGGPTKLYRNDGAAPGLRVRLVGPAANPDAIGSTIRLVSGESLGPSREIQAGSGYWSQNGAVQVLGGYTGATAVWVRWPDGTETEVPIGSGTTEMTVRYSR